MPFPERLAIASKNLHKLRELGRICRDWPVEWLTVSGLRGKGAMTIWSSTQNPHILRTMIAVRDQHGWKE